MGQRSRLCDDFPAVENRSRPVPSDPAPAAATRSVSFRRFRPEQYFQEGALCLTVYGYAARHPRNRLCQRPLGAQHGQRADPDLCLRQHHAGNRRNGGLVTGGGPGHRDHGICDEQIPVPVNNLRKIEGGLCNEKNHVFELS